MKQIYTFTLEDEEVPSDKFTNDIKLIAYLLYEELYNNSYEDNLLVPNDDYIRKNNLYEVKLNNFEYKYYFESENSHDKRIIFNPLIVSDRSFQIILNDNNLDISLFLNSVLLLLKLNYKFKIDVFPYNDKIKNKFNLMISSIKNSPRVLKKVLPMF